MYSNKMGSLLVFAKAAYVELKSRVILNSTRMTTYLQIELPPERFKRLSLVTDSNSNFSVVLQMFQSGWSVKCSVGEIFLVTLNFTTIVVLRAVRESASV